MNKTFRYRIDEISFCILVTLITSFAIIALIMSNYDRLNVAQIYQIWWVNNSGTPGGHDDISWWAFMLRSCCDVNTFYSYWTMNERNDLILVPYIISRICKMNIQMPWLFKILLFRLYLHFSNQNGLLDISQVCNQFREQLVFVPYPFFYPRLQITMYYFSKMI